MTVDYYDRTGNLQASAQGIIEEASRSGTWATESMSLKYYPRQDLGNAAGPLILSLKKVSDGSELASIKLKKQQLTSGQEIALLTAVTGSDWGSDSSTSSKIIHNIPNDTFRLEIEEGGTSNFYLQATGNPSSGYFNFSGSGSVDTHFTQEWLAS